MEQSIWIIIIMDGFYIWDLDVLWFYLAFREEFLRWYLVRVGRLFEVLGQGYR